MIRQQISLTNRPTRQSTTLINKRSQWQIWAENRRLKSRPPLVRRLDIPKNIPVSVNKLSSGLRDGFITSYLTADKLFPVNSRAIMAPPKMSLLLEAKCMPALIIKPRLILVTHPNDHGPSSRDRCSFKTSTGLSACQMLRQGRSRIAPQTVLFQLTWCFRKSFL